jgi:serine/threonine protein kinase
VRKRDTRRVYAMKVLSKSEIEASRSVAHVLAEWKVLQSTIHSPFLVGLKFSFQTDTQLCD